MTVAPFVGFETQTEPADVVPGSGGGIGAAAGKGAVPLVGPALISTWTVGQVLALPPPLPPVLPGLLPPGVGVGVDEGPLVEELGLPPQAVSTPRASKRTKVDAIAAKGRLCFKDTGTHLRLFGKLPELEPLRIP